MCTHQAQPSIFSTCGFFTILAKIFQDPLCAWWVHIPVQLFRKGEPSTQTVFWCNLGQKKFSKILRLNSKGKVAIWPFWDRFSSAKKVFLTCYGTSSKHHRRCLEVQRTRLKRFLTSEPKWGLLRLETHLVTKIGFFWAEISDGCAYVCTYFWWGAWPKKGRKGHTFVGKVVRPRSDTWFSKKSILSKPKIGFPRPANTWSTSFKSSIFLEKW